MGKYPGRAWTEVLELEIADKPKTLKMEEGYMLIQEQVIFGFVSERDASKIACFQATLCCPFCVACSKPHWTPRYSPAR